MKKTRTNENVNPGENSIHALPDYVPPKIVSYTREEILERIGPAQACSPQGATSNGGGVVGSS